VVTNLRFDWEGQRKVVVDLFRLQDGKVAEHWDAVQDEPETTLNGHPMMDGPVEIEDLDLTQANKTTAAAFYQRVFIDQQPDALADFVGADLRQHCPEIANGIEGLRSYLLRQSGGFRINQMHRVIGEGNFVVIQSEGLLEQQPAVFYEVFRLREGKIVEQWRVSQRIPEWMAHTNGII
jgi:predicted SnoaL-like aldol condensation-catalyzing enzyme